MVSHYNNGKSQGIQLRLEYLFVMNITLNYFKIPINNIGVSSRLKLQRWMNYNELPLPLAI